MDSITQRLFASVDASSLAVFRIGFGALLIFNSINEMFLCLHCQYLQPSLVFSYRHFDWVQPWPTTWALYAHWTIMALCSVAIMLGYYYRFAMVLFTIMFSYAFLLEQAIYLNHYYMVILFCILMIFLPANSLWSLDARRDTRIANPEVARWCIILLVLQLEIILIHAGLAKLTPDWLNLEPLRMWMQGKRPEFPPIFTTLTNDIGIAIGAYGAIALHLLGAPLLFFKRWQIPVLCTYACFHVMNHLVFNIGIFPWFTLFASLLFLAPDWPRKLWAKIRAANTLPAPALLNSSTSKSASTTGRVVILTLMTVWLIGQILIPLRHWSYPGNVAWNEDGHLFSWRMKLRSKRGTAQYRVVAVDGREWLIDPSTYLTAKQHRKMTCIPDLLWQFANFIGQEKTNQENIEVAVYVDAHCSLNSRPKQRMIAFDTDLTKVARSPASNWVLPLVTPLPGH